MDGMSTELVSIGNNLVRTNGARTSGGMLANHRAEALKEVAFKYLKKDNNENNVQPMKQPVSIDFVKLASHA